MAFDLDYVFVPCNHRYVDDTIQLAITAGKNLVDPAAIFNDDIYLGDIYMGDNVYVDKADVSAGGSVTANSDGTLTARFPIKYRVAHSPRLFRKKPWDYQREEITQTAYTEWATVVRYKRGHRFNTVRYLSSSPVISKNPQVQWDVIFNYDSSNNYISNDVIIQQYDPTFTYIMDYTIEPSECPHCFGSGFKHDLLFDATGKINIVLNTKKLVQQVMKAILTYKGKNYYYSDYGTTIKQLLGTKNTFLGFLIRSEITAQLQRIKNLHDSGIQTSPGLYGPYETLKDLLSVEIYPTVDSRAVELKAIIQTNTLENLNTKVMRIA